ncbi:MAG: hypothetical protein HYU64_07035 [Armatimonadetes bacterium]|nr:hypothetical protein [Armatimonadota bacterium]
MMKASRLICLLLAVPILLQTSTGWGVAKETAFQVKETAHFQIEHQDENMAGRLARVAEDVFPRILRDLDAPSPLDLPIWKGRKIRVTLYNTRAEYTHLATHPPWSDGHADSFKLVITMHREQSSGAMGRLFTHELTHLIFDNYLGFSHTSVNWISEGLAELEEARFARQAEQTALYIEQIRKGTYIPLEQLVYMDVHWERDSDKVRLWYAEALALSLVTYLIKGHGERTFQNFLSVLRKKSVDQSLEAVYGPQIKNVKDLQESWLQYMKTHEQRW